MILVVVVVVMNRGWEVETNMRDSSLYFRNANY